MSADRQLPGLEQCAAGKAIAEAELDKVFSLKKPPDGTLKNFSCF